MCSLKPALSQVRGGPGFEATRAAEIHISVLIGKCILCGGEVGQYRFCLETWGRVLLPRLPEDWSSPASPREPRPPQHRNLGGEEKAITGLHLELYVWGDLKSVSGQKSAALECNSRGAVEAAFY